MPIQQEIDGNGRHRLIDTTTGEATQWAGYTQFTFLRGFVGFTGFYQDREGVVSADEFCARVGVGKQPR